MTGGEHKHPEYFEGILQLRDFSEKLYNYIHEIIERDSKEDKRARITKEKKVRGGVDLYFFSQKYIQQIGKKLKEKFKGELKVTSRLHSRHKITGKELHRVTVFFKEAKVKKGDIIERKGKIWEVILVDKDIVLKEMKSGKKERVKLGEAERLVK